MKSKKIQKKPFSLSVVMPVYNEQDVIRKVVRNFCEAVLDKFEKPEFIIVNDCSSDATLSILKGLKREYPYLQVFTNSSNQGHGVSLMRAYHKAKGDYIFHCDSDNQFMAEDFWPLWEKLKKEELGLVMGYRKKRNDPLYRIGMSFALRIFDRIFFGFSCYDINAPFKLYNRSALEKILPIVPKDAFVPSILLVLAAHKREIKLGEIGIRHFPRLTGKSFIRNWKIINFCLRALDELIQFRRKLQNLKR